MHELVDTTEKAAQVNNLLYQPRSLVWSTHIGYIPRPPRAEALMIKACSQATWE